MIGVTGQSLCAKLLVCLVWFTHEASPQHNPLAKLWHICMLVADCSVMT